MVGWEWLITAMSITPPSGMLTTGHKRSHNDQAAITVDQPQCGNECCSRRLGAATLPWAGIPTLSWDQGDDSSPTDWETNLNPVLVASLTLGAPFRHGHLGCQDHLHRFRLDRGGAQPSSVLRQASCGGPSLFLVSLLLWSVSSTCPSTPALITCV